MPIRVLSEAVTVERLFYNVPARRKFLRTDRTERRHIDQWLTRYAMAYPEIRFMFSHNGRNVFQSTGNGKLRDVLVSVYGLGIGAAALEIMDEDQAPSDGPEIKVSGLVGPLSLHRANRTYITLFVNGRWVQDASLTYAVIQAYHTLLLGGRYPIAVRCASGMAMRSSEWCRRVCGACCWSVRPCLRPLPHRPRPTTVPGPTSNRRAGRGDNGWRDCRLSFREGLRRTVDWYKEH